MASIDRPINDSPGFPAPLGDLATFDAPTGFAVGVNSVSAGVNRRKSFLADLGLLNKIGLRQDGLSVTPDDELVIGDTSLEALNAALGRQGLGELTVVPTASFCRHLGDTYARLSATGLRLINPAPIPRLLTDKALQYWELYDRFDAVPPWQPLDYYLTDGGQLRTDALARDLISGAPLVVKARDGTQGRRVWFYPDGVTGFLEDWTAGSVPSPVSDAPGRFLLQYGLPHECDLRILAAGGTPVAGERRYGSSETDRSNLDLVATEAGNPLDTARELLTRDAVAPIDPGQLDPAIERAIGDLHSALAGIVGARPSALHTWIGWDLLLIDPDDERLSAVPDAVLDELLHDRYRTRRDRYLVFGEGNLSPGSKERYVNAVAHGRQGLRWDSAANLLAYGHAISTGRRFTPGRPELLDPDTLATAYDIE